MKVNLRCSLRHQTSFHVTNFHKFSERLTDTMAGSSPNTLPMQTREDVTSSGVQLESNWVDMNRKLVQRAHSFPLQNQEIRPVFRAALEVRTFKEMAFLGAEDMFPDGKSSVYPGCSIERCGLLQFVSLVLARRYYPAQSCYKISFAVCSSVWDSTAVDKSDVPHVCFCNDPYTDHTTKKVETCKSSPAVNPAWSKYEAWGSAFCSLLEESRCVFLALALNDPVGYPRSFEHWTF